MRFQKQRLALVVPLGGGDLGEKLIVNVPGNFVPNVWVVQTQDQRPIEHPNEMIVRVERRSLVPMKRLHPCPKPVEELAFLVKALTKPGQIVLDCFCGLGSTLVAAEMLGRRWIGCDLSRRYCQIAMKRLAELPNGKLTKAM